MTAKPTREQIGVGPWQNSPIDMSVTRYYKGDDDIVAARVFLHSRHYAWIWQVWGREHPIQEGRVDVREGQDAAKKVADEALVRHGILPPTPEPSGDLVERVRKAFDIAALGAIRDATDNGGRVQLPVSAVDAGIRAVLAELAEMGAGEVRAAFPTDEETLRSCDGLSLDALTVLNTKQALETRVAAHIEPVLASLRAENAALRERVEKVEGPPAPGTNATRFLVLHKRDDSPWAVYPFETHEEARIAYDTFAIHWTGTFLVRVVAGQPNEVRAEQPHMPRIFEELLADRNALRERVAVAEKQAAIFRELQEREIPCGHKVEDLIGGEDGNGQRLVTKCGACLQAKQAERATCSDQQNIGITKPPPPPPPPAVVEQPCSHPRWAKQYGTDGNSWICGNCGAWRGERP